MKVVVPDVHKHHDENCIHLEIKIESGTLRGTSQRASSTQLSLVG